MSTLIKLLPAKGIEEIGVDSGRWRMSPGGKHFEVHMQDGVFPVGWVLLQGKLIRHGGDYDARLYFDLGDGFSDDEYFEIPASGKGGICELLFLPAGIRGLKFMPMGTEGEFGLGELAFSTVGAVQRRWCMVRRIVSIVSRNDWRNYRSANFLLWEMFYDLYGAYQKSGKLLPQAAAPRYQELIEHWDEFYASNHSQIIKHISRFASYAEFHILVISDDSDKEKLRKTLSSLGGQIYRHYSCTVLEVGKAQVQGMQFEGMDYSEASFVRCDDVNRWLQQFNEMLAGPYSEKWILILRSGDEIAPHALYHFALNVLSSPQSDFIYSDDDEKNLSGQRSKPRFKPEWSLAHFRSINFVGDAVGLRGMAVAKAGGITPEDCRFGNYDLLLRMLDATGDFGGNPFTHIPIVLLHRRQLSNDAYSGSGNIAPSKSELNTINSHLARNNVSADVVEMPGRGWQIRFDLPVDLPLVSIIIPVRDMIEITRRCLESILNKTTYPNIEIIVVDNQSVEPATQSFLDDISRHEKIKLMRYDLPFNYSAINNLAARGASGDVICLLNNDTEVISPDWLEEMVGNLMQPQVGVVGAKLYFPDDRIQHAGDLVGVGTVASHTFKYLERESAGYCNRAMVVQEFSAVTAACMITWNNIYQQLGGLDEKNLAVTYNDVDYCLRVREAGYSVVWTPHAELYHYESVSRREKLNSGELRRAKNEVAYMQKRWHNVLRNDPYYSPNLSHERPDFSLSYFPIVQKPWQT